MSPARLLEHFDRLIDTPDAVPRLRRFILDLAVRGKLVEQDPKDEPAGELLKRITKEKARLIKEGSIRQQETRFLTEDDAPFALPDGWEWTQLAEIGVVNPRCQADDSAAASFVPMPMISAKYGQAHEHEVRQWGEIKKGFTTFAEGDVGLAKITPCFENGKSTIFRGLTGGLGAGTTELHVLRPVFVSADYILVFLKSSHFIETGIPKMTGTAGQKRVSREYFAFSPVPLPPLAEQHRIVAKVDELMALCDELEAAQTKREKRRDRLVAATLLGLNTNVVGRDGSPSRPDRPHPNSGGFGETALPGSFEESARFYFNHLPRLTTRPEHIHQLRQTILNLAVRGKLVSQDPKGEPSSVLLVRLSKGKERIIEELGLRQQPELSGDADQVVPFHAPAAWAWSIVDECFVVTGGIQKTPLRTPQDNAYPYVGVSNVYRGRLDLSEIKQFELREGELEKLRLEPDDLLVVEGNGSPSEVGRCARWSGEIRDCVYQNHIIRCRAGDPGIARFIEIYLNSETGVEIMRSLAVTSAGLYNLSVGKIRRIKIPIPPLAEQRRIVAKADELLALCDDLEGGMSRTMGLLGDSLEACLTQTLA